MSQIRNKSTIRRSIEEDNKLKKTIPNFFNSYDEIPFGKGMTISLCVHIVFALLLMLFGAIHQMVVPETKKVQDVEFKLVQNESQKPINPNTRNRSDRDSRAGGKHDPKRAVAEPSPSPAPKQQPQPAAKPQAKQAPAKTAQLPKTQPAPKQPVKQQPAPKTVAQKPKTQPAPVFPTVKKPTPIKAPTTAKPVAAPTYRPSVAPSAPKVASAPKSPFQIAVPPSKAPVGGVYRPQPSSTSKGPVSSGGGSTGQSLAPKFSASKTGSGGGSGSSGGRAGSPGVTTAYRPGGGGGHGSSGNPSPGNPRGTPGIDAIRQPNWGPYMRDLEQRIKRNWSPPKGDSSKRVVITFTISRDGRLLSKSVTKSSGVPSADRAAMMAIEATAPFRPLPPEFKGTSVPIEFTFDYNVLNSVLK